MTEISIKQSIAKQWHALTNDKTKSARAKFTQIAKAEQVVNPLDSLIVPQPTTHNPQPANKQWYVYLLECMDGSFYTGVTNDLDKRMKTHAEGKGSKYVRHKRFKCLLRAKECKDRSDAQKAECHIKTLQKYDKLDWFKN